MHVELKIEVGRGVNSLEFHVIAKVKAAPCLNDIAKHFYDIAILAVEAQLRVAVVIFEVVLVHFPKV